MPHLPRLTPHQPRLHLMPHPPKLHLAPHPPRLHLAPHLPLHLTPHPPRVHLTPRQLVQEGRARQTCIIRLPWTQCQQRHAQVPSPLCLGALVSGDGVPEGACRGAAGHAPRHRPHASCCKSSTTMSARPGWTCCYGEWGLQSVLVLLYHFFFVFFCINVL